ncbi:hypothetical protein EVAR_3431_1 [Eumeta japonica]|uniref:Uncharacterized protein n=1 Tax=Eumeta variegata TaxID=151549 RepID=A0A4C1ST40_EUMVA|nr:hypothetical protein EVAR_3431_1 [Eumeta japonica]
MSDRNTKVRTSTGPTHSINPSSKDVKSAPEERSRRRRPPTLPDSCLDHLFIVFVKHKCRDRMGKLVGIKGQTNM